MSGTFLREELGVAMSGVKWDIGNFKLWQSTSPSIVLFTPKQPSLAKSSNGRYQAAVSQFRQQTEGTYKITGGSAIFTVTSAIQYDANAMKQLQEAWINEMNAMGPAAPRGVRFIPLNVQKGTAEVLINDVSGTADQAHNDKDIGTPGGTNSFLVELTSLGAQEWVQGIKEKKGIPAGVKMMYEYLRLLPDVGATVKVHGRRAFRHYSASLKAQGGLFFGAKAQIDAAWEKMERDGTVEVTFIGHDLPPELQAIRMELTSTFAAQAREQLFNMMFAPKPDVPAAQAGSSGGLFGGVSFAMKYRSEEEVVDMEQTIKFTGWTWLKASMDADLTALLHNLDATYVNEVNTEMSFPASIVIDADPQLENVAVSWSASEGKSPEAPVFDAQGGSATYTVTSHRPDDVEISYTAKVNFAPPTWPVVESKGKARVRDGGNQAIIKPASWIGRHMIFMFIEQGGQMKTDEVENDYLIVNVSYTGPHLPRAIKASARISIFEPIEFSYPLSPTGQVGEAKFSAFGVVGGTLRRSKEQPINFEEEAVFIVVSESGIQLVSQATPVTESGLAGRLLRANARPVFEGAGAPEGNRAVEVYRRTPGGVPTPGGTRLPEAGASPGQEVQGTVIAVEYSAQSQALVVEQIDGNRIRVPVRSHELADRFDDQRKRVHVLLDPKGFASEVRVEL